MYALKCVGSNVYHYTKSYGAILSYRNNLWFHYDLPYEQLISPATTHPSTIVLLGI